MKTRSRAAPKRGRAREIGQVWKVVGNGAPSLEALTTVEKGLPLVALDDLRDVLTKDEVDRLIIPRRTEQYRRVHGETLNAEESDRALRIARVIKAAEESLGSRERAMLWLRNAHHALGRRQPLEISRTEAGARFVENMLARIAWGAAV